MGGRRIGQQVENLVASHAHGGGETGEGAHDLDLDREFGADPPVAPAKPPNTAKMLSKMP